MEPSALLDQPSALLDQPSALLDQPAADLAPSLTEGLMDFALEQGELWISMYLFDAGRYLFGVILVSGVLYGLLRHWSASRKIQSAVATGADKRRELFYSLQTIGVYATVGLFEIAAEHRGWLKFYETGDQYSGWYTALSLPIVLVLHDTYFYWVHRAMHHRSVFRLFHRVHHLSRTPTPLAAYSFAVPEAFLMALFLPLITALIPLHITVVFIFLAIMIVRNAMGHSGIEFHHLRWVDGPLDRLTTITHHDMHHQKFTGNYGLYFTWWDRWMGTELPNYKEEFRRAIVGRAVHGDNLPITQNDLAISQPLK